MRERKYDELCLSSFVPKLVNVVGVDSFSLQKTSTNITAVNLAVAKGRLKSRNAVSDAEINLRSNGTLWSVGRENIAAMNALMPDQAKALVLLTNTSVNSVAESS